MNELQAYQWIEDQVNEYRLKHQIKEDLWFRGEGELYPKMISSMIRNLLGTNPPNTKLNRGEKEEILKYERWIYNKFLDRVTFEHPSGHVHQGLKNWDMVYYLQHYGMNTRFLDWTDKLAVSIYFSGGSAKEGKDAMIWLLNPVEFNRLSQGQPHIINPTDTYENLIHSTVMESTFIKPTAISAYRPSTINQRIYNQEGHFVFTGLNHSCLREYITDLAAQHSVPEESFFYGITVPYNTIKLAYNYVSKQPLNVNKDTLGLEEPELLKEEYSYGTYKSLTV